MTDFEDVRQIGDCTLYLGDCERVLPHIGKVDALVTDPPYGLGEGRGKIRDGVARSINYGNSDWDDKTINADLIASLMQVTDQQIIFGGNYYDLPPTSCWLVWDKKNGTSDFADCELAWTNLTKAVRMIRLTWNGFAMPSYETRGIHPTQKPVDVMRWCLTHVPKARTIFDPFMGSGTTGVACARDGRAFVGIERERKYFEAACTRIEEAYRQPDMLVHAAAKPAQQTSLFEDET